MNPDLILRARGLLNELRRVRVVDKASVWWGSHEGVLARRALSAWLGTLLEPQVVARADQPIPILWAWIAKNGPRLEGHPDYEKLSEEEKKQVELLGRYTPEAVHLPSATVKAVLGKVPEGFKKKRFHTQEGSYILGAMLLDHPALLQWCKENAHRIEGHPRYQEREKPLGGYEPEVIALPQREYERILGLVPEGVAEVRVFVGTGELRHRKSLYKVRLKGKESF